MLVLLAFLHLSIHLLMKAYFDKRKHPKVILDLKGKKQSGKLEAILDTGFDGYLALPINIAVSLGLELASVVQVEYADGRTREELVFSVEVALENKWKPVFATLTGGSEALAGTALFDNYEIRINFSSKKISITK